MVKGATVIALPAGQVLAPALTQGVDAGAAAQQVKDGKIANPENFPLWQRTGIMVPGILGAIGVGVAGFADDLFAGNDAAQLGTLGFSITSLTGSIIEAVRAVQARIAVGLPAFGVEPKDAGKDATLKRCIAYYCPPQVPSTTRR